MRTWQNKRCVLFLSIWKTTSVKTQYCLCQAATCPTWVKVLSFKLLLHKLSFLFIFIFVYNCHCQAVRRSRFVSQGLKKNIKKKVAIVDRSLENHFASVFRASSIEPRLCIPSPSSLCLCYFSLRVQFRLKMNGLNILPTSIVILPWTVQYQKIIRQNGTFQMANL